MASGSKIKRMNKLRAISYASSAIKPFDDLMLENLLVSARNFNAQVEVTGVLLYRESTFFQYLEGPPERVALAYDRILASKSHHAVIKLSDDDIAEREFPDWNMGLVTPPQRVPLQFSQASWEAERRKLDAATQWPSDGLMYLQGFRRGASQRL
jgi:hypothetical protein